MVSRDDFKELIYEINERNKQQNEIENKKITEEEYTHRIKDWTTLFRRNLDIFNQDFLEIEVAEFQKIMINNISDNEVTVNVCSRGIGK